jgi:hypothetical protein
MIGQTMLLDSLLMNLNFFFAIFVQPFVLLADACNIVMIVASHHFRNVQSLSSGRIGRYSCDEVRSISVCSLLSL